MAAAVASDFDGHLPAGLRYVEARDARTDEEILQSVCAHRPVASERNIWAFWHSGLAGLPAWYRRNIVGWVRLNGPRWTVRLLDRVAGSPNNVLAYVCADMLPAAWDDMDGPWVGQHSADFARTALLAAHGGAWFDAGLIMFRRLDDFAWGLLQGDDGDHDYSKGGDHDYNEGGDHECNEGDGDRDDNDSRDDNDNDHDRDKGKIDKAASPYRICAGRTIGTGIMNGFLAARRGDPLIARWHALFLRLWDGGRVNCDGLHAHPLLRPVLQAQAAARTNNQDEAKRFGFDFAADPARVTDYVAQIIAWGRVVMTDCGSGNVNDNDDGNSKGDGSDNGNDDGNSDGKGFSGVDYLRRRVLLIDAVDEMCGAEATLGSWRGADFFAALSTPLDSPRDSPGYLKASQLVWRLLARSCMQTVFHGKTLLREPSLATLWDRLGHDSTADADPHTFAGLLRRGAVHYEQSRRVPYVAPAEPETVLHKALFEE